MISKRIRRNLSLLVCSMAASISLAFAQPGSDSVQNGVFFDDKVLYETKSRPIVTSAEKTKQQKNEAYLHLHRLEDLKASLVQEKQTTAANSPEALEIQEKIDQTDVLLEKYRRFLDIKEE